MRYTRKSFNCTAHAGDDQNNGGHVESNPANDRAYTTRYPVIFIDQCATPTGDGATSSSACRPVYSPSGPS